MVLGLGLLSLAMADTALGWVSLAMFVLGLGLGSCMQPLLLIVQSAVPPSEIGVATSSATFFRQIGGTLGVASRSPWTPCSCSRPASVSWRS